MGHIPIQKTDTGNWHRPEHFGKVGSPQSLLSRKKTDLHVTKGFREILIDCRDRIEGLKSARGTQALNFKSFQLEPF